MKRVSFTMDDDLWRKLEEIKAKKRFCNLSIILRESLLHFYLFFVKNTDKSVSQKEAHNG